MKWSFAFFHWLLTLSLAPFTSQLFQILFFENAHRIVGLVEIYPITFIFSIIFSFPTLCFYILFFNYLQKTNLGIIYRKLLLILFAILGITLTMLFLKGSMTKDIISAYTITTLLVGIFLPLREQPSSNK